MAKRNKARPMLTQAFWIAVGDRFKADPQKLREALDRSGRDEEELRRRLGAAYSDLARALAGQELNKWTAAIIDWAIEASDESPFVGHSAPSYREQSQAIENDKKRCPPSDA